MSDPREIIDKSPMTVLQHVVVVLTVLMNAIDGFDAGQRLVFITFAILAKTCSIYRTKHNTRWFVIAACFQANDHILACLQHGIILYRPDYVTSVFDV